LCCPVTTGAKSDHGDCGDGIMRCFQIDIRPARANYDVPMTWLVVAGSADQASGYVPDGYDVVAIVENSLPYEGPARAIGWSRRLYA
jgi:hypothetical protein